MTKCCLRRAGRSAFVLELPPFRRPHLGKIIVESLFQRTFKVLARAVIVAFPAGILIYSLANIVVQGHSLLSYGIQLLDPLGHLVGLDGVILMAFILGFPANEIVLPLMAMMYTGQGVMSAGYGLVSLRVLFFDHGWTVLTDFAAFSLFDNVADDQKRKWQLEGRRSLYPDSFRIRVWLDADHADMS